MQEAIRTRSVSCLFRRMRNENNRGSRLAYRHNPPNRSPGNTGVVRGVLGISATEVILHGAQIGALVGQVVAARMAQVVGPDPAELRLGWALLPPGLRPPYFLCPFSNAILISY